MRKTSAPHFYVVKGYHPSLSIRRSGCYPFFLPKKGVGDIEAELVNGVNALAFQRLRKTRDNSAQRPSRLARTACAEALHACRPLG